MRAGFQQMDIDNTENPDITLRNLGFEEGELEMFFYMQQP